MKSRSEELINYFEIDGIPQLTGCQVPKEVEENYKIPKAQT